MRGRPPGALRRYQRCHRGVRGAREASGAWQRLRVSFVHFVHPAAEIRRWGVCRPVEGGGAVAAGPPPLPVAGRARRAAAAVRVWASRWRTRPGGTGEALEARGEGAASRRWLPGGGIEAPSRAVDGAPSTAWLTPSRAGCGRGGDGVASGTLMSFGARSSVKCPADGGRAVQCLGRGVGVQEVGDQSVEGLWHVKARNVRGVPDEQWRRICRSVGHRRHL